MIKINSRWKHSSGRIYSVITLTNLESTREDYPVTVVYQGESGTIWSRPYSDWHRSMTELLDESVVKVCMIQLSQGTDNVYYSRVLDIKGVHSDGKTIEDAMKRIGEALEVAINSDSEGFNEKKSS